MMKKGELQTTEDINRKFLMGQVESYWVWCLEDKSKPEEEE